MNMDKARFYQVKSFSDPNKIYVVRQLPDGSWHCSCPQGVFRGKCNHIQKIRHLKLKIHEKNRKKRESMDKSKNHTG
jgi:hypothetical protein